MPSDLHPWPWRTPIRRASVGRDREFPSAAVLRADSLRADPPRIDTLPQGLRATVLHWSEKPGILARTANSSDSAARQIFSPPSRPSIPDRRGGGLGAVVPPTPRMSGRPPV